MFKSDTLRQNEFERRTKVGEMMRNDNLKRTIVEISLIMLKI